MSGMELCRRLKNDPITGYIPVYIMTAAEYAEPEAKEAGAEGVISKSFSKMNGFIFWTSTLHYRMINSTNLHCAKVLSFTLKRCIKK